MAQILHENSKGVIMVRENYKRRSQVKVYSGYPDRKYCLRTYRFDYVQESLEVPYCSWANLDCCGGWSFDKEYLDTAVQKGMKLFAGRITNLKSEYLPNCPTMKEAKRQFAEMKETLPSDIFADVENGNGTVRADVLHTYICRAGTISEYIDLDMVFGFYERLGVHISAGEKAEIRHLCGIELRQYGAANAPFQYAQAVTDVQLITTGLLLGYPVESTVSILQGY